MNAWAIVGRGLAGWHAGAKGVSSSGGDLLPYTYWTGEKCCGYLAEAVENALVYDASEADENAFIAHVLGGPMVDFRADPDFVGVNYVGVAVFEKLLRSVPGVKVGHVKSGVIVWD